MDNLIWKKSTRSSPNGGHCIEVSVTHASRVLVRDSKTQSDSALCVSMASWQAFVRRIRTQH
ncbi:DUF397 domain-containing protein [Catenuloplanes japonicus]|uniref:DUF397 domain-containing protein n=1 Tax=Catenuloplanes japonicus TaxID=33876 RepID=UPI000A11BECF|nr:DUF397 domain-containing protein [Catenuloplanes japonicus]